MTGHQENPGSGYTLRGEVAAAIRIEDLLKAMGYEKVIIVDPQDLAAMQKALDDAVAFEGHAAVIVRRPCLLIKRLPPETGLCTVDGDKCVGCKSCLKLGCPALMFKDRKTRIDPTLCVGCTLCAQVCPFGAIRKEEG
jgi:indolepyruvate ferredoxin oxidoreductase alpha subunit